MAFDGFVNKAIVNELNTSIKGGKIVKIYQPSKDEFIYTIYANGNKYNLYICINSSNCRINLTSTKKDNPLTPPNFCMVLRKHLIGSKIKSIETRGLDRLVIFHLETYNELNDLINKKLIIELMGKHSNVILLNENDIIIDSAGHISSERNILPANPYSLPESSKINIYDLKSEDFLKKFKNSQSSFMKFVQNNFYGFSKTFINYVLDILKIEIQNITDYNIATFYEYIIRLSNNIDLLRIDCIDYSFNNKMDYVLISSENTSDLKVNTFIDNYYTYKEKSENFENYRNNVLKLILNILKKYEKRLSNINIKLKECNDMDKYKLYGELLTANLYRINNNINIESISLENYYDNNDLIEIKLDKRYSPSVNAKRFFKKYNKLKNTLEIVSKHKEDTKKELDYIESIIYSLNSANNLNDVDEIYLEIQENILNNQPVSKQKNKPENKSVPIALDIDGYNVFVGRNNKQNDYLTFKVANKEDLWFHTENIHGSHVILKLNKSKEITDDIISRVASIAAYYSKGRNSSKVNVQYTEVKNIKKPKNAKPGFVVFNHYKTIMVEPKEKQ